jgi:hypothetical protein
VGNFIHAREHLAAGTTVQVNCDHQCNVLVMDDTNFAAYRRRGRYTYRGGFAKSPPAFVTVPHSGYWNTVVDLAGAAAHVRYDISYIR